MENKPKKSKALIITIIALILLLIAGYLIFKNRDVFGVKTSTSIAKIFSPLISSTNSKNLTQVESGNTGQITPNTNPNSFFNSFSNFLGGMFNKNNQGVILPSGNSCANGATNPPLCTIGPGGMCINGKTNPPACIIDNSCANGATNTPLCTINPEGSCINGATNPPLCTIGPGGACMNGATNPPDCTNLGGDPDLIAGNVAPTSTTINTPTKISATITNNGGSSTVKSFSSFFTIARTLPTATHVEVVTITPLLESKIGNIAEITYSFNTAGEYQIRACADKKSSSDAGAVTESNEDNNCGPWTTFTVTNSLPTGGDLAPGETTPPGGGIVPSDSSLTPYVNACLLIDKNPLTFTDDEQSQLDELLRKFYLIAPNLKTEDDINIAYSTITQYQNFSDQLSTLINQCYLQTNDRIDRTLFCANKTNEDTCARESTYADETASNYTGPTTRFGNPWYKYSTLRGSYIDTKNSDPAKNFDCKYVSGWFSGTGADGKDCETYNRNINKTGIYDISPASCTTSIRLSSSPMMHSRYTAQDAIYQEGLRNKCVWNPGANISEMEKISNVW